MKNIEIRQAGRTHAPELVVNGHLRVIHECIKLTKQILECQHHEYQLSFFFVAWGSLASKSTERSLKSDGVNVKFKHRQQITIEVRLCMATVMLPYQNFIEVFRDLFYTGITRVLSLIDTGIEAKIEWPRLACFTSALNELLSSPFSYESSIEAIQEAVEESTGDQGR